jgi:hypothetical protein
MKTKRTVRARARHNLLRGTSRRLVEKVDREAGKQVVVPRGVWPNISQAEGSGMLKRSVNYIDRQEKRNARASRERLAVLQMTNTRRRCGAASS